MSFSKALELLRLADLASTRYRGVTLDDICAEFGVVHRTAQRMTAALTAAFPAAIEVTDDGDDRRRRWRLREVPLARLRLSGDVELAALQIAISRLTDDGDAEQARALAGLRDRLLAALPVRDALRAEADAEAMLEAHGVAARPGPSVAARPGVAEAITAALRGPYRLRIAYNGTGRVIEPYGVLLGARRYLVARQPESGPQLRHFRFDRIEDAVSTGDFFTRDDGFDLSQHSAQSFGSFIDPAEYGEVIWRFTPEAAAQAAGWRFHPTQSTQTLPDGALEVRFHASGWLEMTWHLYQWGAAVEVVAPEGLRALVDGWQRSDFAALP